MSFEQDPRRGRRRPGLRPHGRGALAPTLAILGVLVVASLLLVTVWTDVLWYDSLGYLQVYRTQLLTRAGLFLVGAALMAGSVFASLVVAYRSRPVYAPVSAEQASLDRYREVVEPLRRLVMVAVPAGLALFAGSAASQQWQTFLLWWNRVPFGTDDAQFGLDVGFFTFTLPWLQFLVGLLSIVVFFSGLAGLMTHYLYGGLRLQGSGPRLTQPARWHLSVLAFLFLVLRGADYWVGRYALTTSQSSLITGLTYTDAKAVLTARGVLAVIAAIVAVLFLVAAAVDRWRMLPMYGVSLLVVSAIVIGLAYPAVVQRFQVKPSESSLEETYIQRNIDATRAAYGLADAEVTEYDATTEATAAALRDDASTLPGIRLMDPSIVSPTFKQLEQNKQYYSFADSLDVDRYTIDGEQQDTVIAVRELDADTVSDSSNWYKEHIVYTHGFGVVAAAGNETTDDGKPVFLQEGIPSTGELGDYEPRIYFGENSPDYSIVGGPEGSTPQELDYPDDTSANGQASNTYEGDGGVAIGSTWNRLLYALRFQEQNILLSSAVNDESRILYDRDPRDRVEKVAPYLTLDGDPYPAVVDGKVVWILDGYTTSAQYPYSQTTTLSSATTDSLTASTSSVVPLADQQINYIRNSVKATVDAYDGTVTLYAWDDTDPVLQTWMKAFPTTVKPLSDISGDLMSHMRYPEDLFKVQRNMLAEYHVTDASAFFGGADYWSVPDDPTRSSDEQQPPYYLTLQMPGQDEPSFSLTTSFIPYGGTRSVLTGFMAVDSDAGSTAGTKAEGYGTLRLLQLPRDTAVPGPGQIQNTFNADSRVTSLLTLLKNNSSSVEYGNLLTLPVGDGLLYVEPVYVSSTGGTSFPLLQKVIVGFGSKVGYGDTLDEALTDVFGTSGTGTGTSSGSDGSSGGTATATPSPSATSSSTASGDLTEALTDASAAITAADQAMQDGDWDAYGQAQDDLKDAVERAQAAQAQLDAGSASASTSTATGSATPSATSSATASASPTG